MNVTNEREVMIFRNNYQDRVFYSMGISKKLQDGTYENGSINCQFKKDVEIQDRTKIKIKEAWLTFYKDKDKKTVPYIFVNQFEITGETGKNERTELGKAIDKQYVDFGTSVELTDDDIESSLAF